MNRKFATLLVTAASLMASAGASAQTNQQATIPFDFTIGQSVLPAGTYKISQFGHSTVAVRGWKKQHLVSALTLTTPNDTVRKNPDKLIFHKYGNQYFLSEIRGDVGDPAVTLTPSRLEQRLKVLQAGGARLEGTEVALK